MISLVSSLYGCTPVTKSKTTNTKNLDIDTIVSNFDKYNHMTVAFTGKVTDVKNYDTYFILGVKGKEKGLSVLIPSSLVANKVERGDIVKIIGVVCLDSPILKFPCKKRINSDLVWYFVEAMRLNLVKKRREIVFNYSWIVKSKNIDIIKVSVDDLYCEVHKKDKYCILSYNVKYYLNEAWSYELRKKLGDIHRESFCINILTTRGNKYKSCDFFYFSKFNRPKLNLRQNLEFILWRYESPAKIWLIRNNQKILLWQK